MKSNSRTAKQGFTLVELMAVITIIVILAALVVGGMSFVTARQAKNKAQLQIALLSAAIEEYKLDTGRYPGVVDNTPVDGKNMTEELYEVLFYEGYQASENPGGGTTGDEASKIYLAQLDPTSSKQGWVAVASTVPAKTKILDPWGREYRYRKGDNAQNPDFDIWSTGPDGETNPANSAGGLKDAKNRDDLKNF